MKQYIILLYILFINQLLFSQTNEEYVITFDTLKEIIILKFNNREYISDGGSGGPEGVQGDCRINKNNNICNQKEISSSLNGFRILWRPPKNCMVLPFFN